MTITELRYDNKEEPFLHCANSCSCSE